MLTEVLVVDQAREMPKIDLPVVLHLIVASQMLSAVSRVKIFLRPNKRR